MSHIHRLRPDGRGRQAPSDAERDGTIGHEWAWVHRHVCKFCIGLLSRLHIYVLMCTLALSVLAGMHTFSEAKVLWNDWTAQGPKRRNLNSLSNDRHLLVMKAPERYVSHTSSCVHARRVKTCLGDSLCVESNIYISAERGMEYDPAWSAGTIGWAC